MSLAGFILSNVESILVEWEDFARAIWPGAATDPLTLRDHAEQILREVARDMATAQTDLEQSDKSKGEGEEGLGSQGVDDVSSVHAIGRARSGFDLDAVVAEYRALRASVIRLWRASEPALQVGDLEELIRFNEAIDQSLTEAVRSYTETVERSRQLFLAILGHDLRNPLNSVVMSADMLAQSDNLATDEAEVATQITSSAMAMADMIKDLLDFTAGELGDSMPITPEPMDLGRLCEEVVEEMRAAHPERPIHLSVHGELKGQWDEGRLRQVVSNLLGNAMQHGTGEVNVTVEESNDGAGVRVSVHNGGSPIPPEAIGRIFEPLVHGESEPQKPRRLGSMGLGLYIAREVVIAHGGTIEVTSSREVGTTFTAHLPRRPQ